MRANEIKRGFVVEHLGQPWIVRELEKSSPTARGSGTLYRFRLGSIPPGQRIELTLKADESLREIDLQRRPSQYSYRDGERFVFMDSEDYSQYLLDADLLAGMEDYLTEGLEGCQVLLIADAAVSVELPQSVILSIVETAPYMKGASATGRTKTARLTSGLEIQVPEFVENGQAVRVNTETGEYMGRA